MTNSVTVVDYGIGNLKSVCRGLEVTGAMVTLTSDAGVIQSADRLVLPGVGAFGTCMEELRGRGLIPAILKFFQSDRPFLGICVGMQMMMKTGEEFGSHDGLGLIDGAVRAIPAAPPGSIPYKIPHIGWTALRKPSDADWSDTILADCADDEPAYFIHSFSAEPNNPSNLLAGADYHGNKISAAIRSGNRYGCQFHPEKSGPVGIAVLNRFLTLSHEKQIH